MWEKEKEREKETKEIEKRKKERKMATNFLHFTWKEVKRNQRTDLNLSFVYFVNFSLTLANKLLKWRFKSYEKVRYVAAWLFKWQINSTGLFFLPFSPSLTQLHNLSLIFFSSFLSPHLLPLSSFSRKIEKEYQLFLTLFAWLYKLDYGKVEQIRILFHDRKQNYNYVSNIN